MDALLSYSGLTTKIRAMQSRLLTDDQYRELAELKSVPQAVTYLKQQPAYEAILDSLSEEALHRGKIEQLLVNSIYRRFTRSINFQHGAAQISQSLFRTIRSVHHERMSE